MRGSDGLCERCEPNEAGELLIKITGSTRFEGYTNPSASEKKILRDAFVKGDAYFRTGDLLRIDEDGFYYFVDRIGDTFRWKGENVATSEVAEVISVDAGRRRGERLRRRDPGPGRPRGHGGAGREPANSISTASVRRHPQGLAAYARPLFLRILPEMEITGTFKHRKVDLVREGFDPRKIPDAIYFRDAAAGRYVPLDAGALRRDPGRADAALVALESFAGRKERRRCRSPFASTARSSRPTRSRSAPSAATRRSRIASSRATPRIWPTIRSSRSSR